MRSRVIAFVGVCSLAVGVAGAYVGVTAVRGASAVVDDARVQELRGAAHVVFRSTDRRAVFGRVAVRSRADGAVATTGLVCDRVHMAAGRGLCLAPSASLGRAYVARVFDSRFRVTHEVRLNGFASRARVSRDGRYGAATTFVTGHSYADPGNFSTETRIVDLARGDVALDLDDLRVTHDGRAIAREDFNYWGVTFRRDSNRFYATLATGGKTYLIDGDIARRTARTLHENVECPSLSPDGTRVAYKKLVGSDPAIWHLYLLDLRTMRETPLAETRAIDDQAEWLDDGRLLYQVDEQTWVVPANGGGMPRLFLERGTSPAVVDASA